MVHVIFRLIHILTEQVLSSPNYIMDNINETAKYPNKPFGIYGQTKKLAEIEALKLKQIIEIIVIFFYK